MPTITQLTAEQEAKLKPWADMWIEKCLSVRPTDHARAEEAVRKIYRTANLKVDGLPIIWVKNPEAGAILAARKFAELTQSTKLQWHGWLGGHLWGGYTAWFTYMRDVLGVTIPDTGWEDLTESCGYLWPNTHFIILCERATAIHMDANGRLHNERGKAIEYGDGWGLWMWHGTRVTEQIILNPSSLTVEQIDAERNAETRRVALERFGLTRWIVEGGAKVVAEDRWGALYSKPRGGDSTVLAVKVTCPSTGHVFIHRVNPECRPMKRDGLGEPQKLTPLNAIASMWGMTGAEYSSGLEAEA